jgi:trimeric autotransporter adhesin
MRLPRFRWIVLFSLVLVLCFAFGFRGEKMKVIAGGVGVGYAEDVTEARKSPLNGPSSLALDSAGNLYIADSENHVIRRVDKNGIITTIAGTANKKASTADGAARSVRLGHPCGLAFDKAGNLYFAENSGERIRKLTPQGRIVTLAGTGKTGFRGDGGSALKARFDSPSGVAVDHAGNIYIADFRNNRVRRISTRGIITTIAGTGKGATSGDGGAALKAAIDHPKSVTFSPHGELYIGTIDSIRKVDKQGKISTIPPTDERYTPTCQAFDAQGNLYFCSMMRPAVYCVKTDGSFTTVFEQRGSPFSIYPSQRGSSGKNLVGPSALAFDGKNGLYIADGWISSVVHVPIE